MGDAVARAEALATGYADVHCSVLTAASFRTLLADLADTGVIPWRLEAVADVVEGDHEFRARPRAI